MRVGVLGRVVLWDSHGAEVALRPQQRRLLALLAVSESGVTADQIAEHVTSGARADSAVRTAVTRLRAHIGERLVTIGSLYRLDLGPGELDSAEFERHRSAASADAIAHIDELTTALEMWRGEALEDVADESWAHPFAARLDQARLNVLEDCAAAMIEVGRTWEALDLLAPYEPLLAFRERPVELQMRALSASGRTTEALRCFQRFRVTLRDEIGVDPGERLSNLEHELLVASEMRPALDSPEAGPTKVGNLVEVASSFVGRTEEVKRLVEDTRTKQLVTLLGVGGSGKTRLAMRVGAEGFDLYPDGVWFVALASVSDAHSVAASIATSLSVRVEPGASTVRAIVEATSTWQALVVVDNCEHVVEEVRPIVDALVHGCPHVRVLCTSRQRLGTAGEHVHAVEPLSAVEASALFVERSEGIDDRFALRDEDRAVVKAICGRLDWIPLAIELAAARTRHFTIVDIRDRLDDRFRLLRDDTRTEDRHQTLVSTVEWSYRLLDATDRTVFERLAVFPGDFDVEAANAVIGEPDGDTDVEQILGSLIDKSLLVADLSGVRARYRLLDTLRDFGLARLERRGESSMLRDVHARHFARRASRIGADYDGFATQSGAFDAVRLEWHNFREAVSWSLASGNPHRAARAAALAPALCLFYDEHAEWVDAILQALPDDDPFAGLLHWFAAEWAALRGDDVTAIDAAEHARSIDHRLAPMSAFVIGEVCHYAGRPAEGLAIVRAALADGDRDVALGDLLMVGCMCAFSIEPDAVRELAERFATLAAADPSPFMLVQAAQAAGYAALIDGCVEDALGRFRLAHELATGLPLLQAEALQNMAVAATRPGVLDAVRHFERAVDELYYGRVWSTLWIVLEAVAVHWTAQDRLRDAAVVVGFLDRNGRTSGFFVHDRRQVAEAVSEFPDERAAGARSDRDALVAFVRDRLSGDQAVGGVMP